MKVHQDVACVQLRVGERAVQPRRDAHAWQSVDVHRCGRIIVVEGWLGRTWRVWRHVRIGHLGRVGWRRRWRWRCSCWWRRQPSGRRRGTCRRRGGRRSSASGRHGRTIDRHAQGLLSAQRREELLLGGCRQLRRVDECGHQVGSAYHASEDLRMQDISLCCRRLRGIKPATHLARVLC